MGSNAIERPPPRVYLSATLATVKYVLNFCDVAKFIEPVYKDPVSDLKLAVSVGH